jgi:hypothetical protein
MATIFPADPVIGDIYQSYEWDGEAWVLIGIDFTKDYAVYPLQTGNNGKFLTTNGAVTSWGTVDLTTKANINSPNLTGIPTAPTAAANTNTTQVATTAFVNAEIANDAIGKSGLQVITQAAGSTINTAGQVNTLQILQTTAQADAFITFHILGDYAAHLGVDGTINDLSYGGWSAGAAKYRVWHAGNQSTLFSSPTFTGTPLAPTPSFGTNTTQIATTAFVQSAVDSVSLNTQTSSYTLVASDAGTLVIMNVGSANNLTVPLNSSVPFAIGTQVPILQLGTGQTTIVATGGVTIRFTPGLKIRTQYSAGALIKIDTDTWLLSGDIVA